MKYSASAAGVDELRRAEVGHHQLEAGGVSDFAIVGDDGVLPGANRIFVGWAWRLAGSCWASGRSR